MNPSWYVKEGGKVYGPFSSAKLKQLATGSKIHPETRLRRGADGDWVKAKQVKGLLLREKSKPQQFEDSEASVAATNHDSTKGEDRRAELVRRSASGDIHAEIELKESQSMEGRSKVDRRPATEIDRAYKTKANIGVGVGFVVWSAGGALSNAADQGSTQAWIAMAIILAGVFLFVWGTSNYALAKGRFAVWGASGILWILGMLVLICLKDRNGLQDPAKSKASPLLVAASSTAIMFALAVVSTWTASDDLMAEEPGGRFTYSNIISQHLDEKLRETVFSGDFDALTPADLAVLESEEFNLELATCQWDWIEEIEPLGKTPIPTGIATPEMMTEIEEIASRIDVRDYWKITAEVFREHGVDPAKLVE